MCKLRFTPYVNFSVSKSIKNRLRDTILEVKLKCGGEKYYC